jgi:hypothetical protein
VTQIQLIKAVCFVARIMMHHGVLCRLFVLLLVSISGNAISWPTTKVVKVRVTADRHMQSPNEKLPRRGPDGIQIVANPVFIDMKLDLGGVVGANIGEMSLCFELYDLTSNIEIETVCMRLQDVKNPPVYAHLLDGHQYSLKAWLVQASLRSTVSMITFEVGNIQNLLPQQIDGQLPKWHSTVPYDRDLVKRVEACVLKKSKIFIESNSEKPGSFTSPALYPEKVYHHKQLGFLGAPVRKVLNKKQLHDVASLVSCAQSVQRADGVDYDGAVAREDFGKFHDDTYVLFLFFFKLMFQLQIFQVS